VPGRPDIVLPKYRAAVFVHGCFWHRHPGCRYACEPKSNVGFWRSKFRESVERDRRVVEDLRRQGWRVAVVWECALRHGDPEAVARRLAEWLSGEAPELELPQADTSSSPFSRQPQ
jgi:DNA mismatch endonuclease (patch repair protein)